MGRRLSSLLPAIAVVWLLVLFVAPLGFVAVYSVGHDTFGGVALGFTLDNYRQALSGFYLHIFLRTLWFSALGSALVLVVATPAAYCVARKAGRYNRVLLVVLLIPFWTSFLIRTLSWQTLLAGNGVVQDVLNALQLHHGELDILDTPTAVMIGIVYGYLPFALVPLYAAFERIPPSLLEASKDLHGGRLRTWWHVTIPLARPGLATAVLLTFVPMTGEVIIPALLGGNKGAMIGGIIYSQFLQAEDFPLGAALAVLVLAVLGVAVALLARASRGFDTMDAS